MNSLEEIKSLLLKRKINIAQNGTYDVSNYDEANVNVSAAGAIDY